MESRTIRTIGHVAYVWLIATDVLERAFYLTLWRLLNYSTSAMRLKPRI